MMRRKHQGGATYLLTLFAVAALGVALARFGAVWTTTLQREREAELIFIGGEFARAMASYRSAGSGTEPEAPPELESLLLDPRFPYVRRHLRKLYRDPMTGKADWLIERQGGRIVGVRSRSTQHALRCAALPAWVRNVARVPEDARYSDWLFHPEERSGARNHGETASESGSLWPPSR
ncbi:MAG TPA: type II secretion system protein [Zoogloea sp.]|uniref:type II secretion system protein n=1 Tax=Zoogloea sp. TaxID=49181 RepID=UPI002CEE8305|nr:type II secretion system protein [Zoogloea sp.]HMW53253.1 type II secretion system protein [Rhodocyclaceae bacterium]HMY48453.1 type II secretion system protein [Rhodocyclaceae bacterium]HMZ75905.1 type II secretion system protein [Rhodocyclaceae bacterium]HNB63157.1 type II secretion system protein [Rhodocyclaceae bacterium]HND25662.1 type II secretion system protein [Rhodocyclaceae bacterium]